MMEEERREEDSSSVHLVLYSRGSLFVVATAGTDDVYLPEVRETDPRIHVIRSRVHSRVFRLAERQRQTSFHGDSFHCVFRHPSSISSIVVLSFVAALDSFLSSLARLPRKQRQGISSLSSIKDRSLSALLSSQSIQPAHSHLLLQLSFNQKIFKINCVESSLIIA